MKKKVISMLLAFTMVAQPCFFNLYAPLICDHLRNFIIADDYFKVLEDYIAANPTMEDGTQNIAYTILCEDWRYFCLENAGQFLAGYPRGR